MKYVMAYGQLGDAEKAMEHWKNCLEMEPDWSAQRIINILELWNFPKNDIEKLMDGVYKAGIPRPGAEPVRPVIAVLPFDNMSGDPEQGYFSDGITEDIITGLSLFPDILVIARNSTFQYKGKAVDVRRVGKELGATYVVEGSVRRSGDRIRVTAQLLDATDGSHLWAETYDRDLSASDIFNLQDEIRGRVVATIADNYGILIQPRSEAATTKRTESLDAYECVLRAMKYLADVLPESHKESRACLERAVEIDPDYAEAWAWLSFVYMGEYQWGYNARPDPLDRALAAAKRAVELNPRSQTAHWGLETMHFLRHELDQFYVAAEKTVSLNPNNSGPLGAFGNWMAFAGNWERGFEWTDMAIALNPVHPSWYYFAHVYPHYLQGNYEAALEDAHKINMPGFYWYHIVLAASSAQMGQKDLAAQAVEDLLTAYPGFTLRTLRDELRIWNFRDEHIEPLVDGLRMAGLGASGEPTAGD